MALTQLTDRDLCLGALFKGLSNPTRFKIFKQLMKGTCCNCEIAQALNISLSLVSHHLSVLEKLDLINSDRGEEDARWIYYSINKKSLEIYREKFIEITDPNTIQNREPYCAVD